MYTNAFITDDGELILNASLRESGINLILRVSDPKRVLRPEFEILCQEVFGTLIWEDISSSQKYQTIYQEAAAKQEALDKRITDITDEPF